MVDNGERHSKAENIDIITDPDEKAEAESRNALRQYDLVLQMIDEAVDPDRPFKLRPSRILSLHRVALEGINAYAGNWRPGRVDIGESKHEPPGAHLVPELLEEMCDYVNDNWDGSTAFHLSAFIMWRLNWIHPFSDGNGRTSRAISYLVLCARLGYKLPGINTIPEQISSNKPPYYDALEAAAIAWLNGNVDVSAMEELLNKMLANQLVSFHNYASGTENANPKPNLH